MKQDKTVRRLTDRDIDPLLALEERVWGSLGIERVPRETLAAWAERGILFGCFKNDNLLGYTYAERINFSLLPPYSTELVAALHEYKEVRNSASGNALHGVSMVSTGMGAGSLLLDTLISLARSEGLSYFVSLARLSGLSRFVADNRETLGRFDLPTTALLYAYQVVLQIDPSRVGPPLRLLVLPEEFPKVSRSDRVVSRFARIGKELWAVAETSFEDPESLNYSALLVLPLR